MAVHHDDQALIEAATAVGVPGHRRAQRRSLDGRAARRRVSPLRRTGSPWPPARASFFIGGPTGSASGCRTGHRCTSSPWSAELIVGGLGLPQRSQPRSLISTPSATSSRRRLLPVGAARHLARLSLYRSASCTRDATCQASAPRQISLAIWFAFMIRFSSQVLT